MYAKKIQIDNYGPIDHLDILFPFEGDAPKPVVLVGENGSGKSIFLSHIVNGLIAAQSHIYPETPEVETNKVYKLRDSTYIKSQREFYFSRVDFEDNLFIEEIRSLRLKREYSGIPSGLKRPDAKVAWEKMERDKGDYIASPFFIAPRLSIENSQEEKIKSIFSRNCILYFPPNRFEEPTWLNEENLRAKANYMNLKHLQGYANRKIITYSPLRDNQNWLFDVIHDQMLQQLPGAEKTALWVWVAAVEVLKQILRIDFGITPGDRHNRRILFVRGREVNGEVVREPVVSNIFQLSTGETSLMNLFLSILRDFDLSKTPFSKTRDIRGIVIVDEIDLHLPTRHSPV